MFRFKRIDACSRDIQMLLWNGKAGGIYLGISMILPGFMIQWGSGFMVVSIGGGGLVGGKESLEKVLT
jgi:hypothetical protein